MKYAVVQKDKKVFDIAEKSTYNNLELSYSMRKANTLCDKLNKGYGFDGWTPPFFSSKLNKKGSKR